MNIKRAKEEIKDSIAAYLLKNEEGDYEIPTVRQRPILLIGPPGIGKTQIMEQVAKECGLGLVAYTITHHTRQSAIGLPFISHRDFGGREYAVTEYTMSEIVASIYNKMEETGLREGILFIDEINCVSETLAPAMLQFLQCKTFGNHSIPQGWIIVAAGNPPEYNKSVREFDVVTLDRVKKIDVEADFEVWKSYAWKAGIHPAVISYLSSRGSYFYRMESTVDGKYFATPRGWEDLSQLLQIYEKLDKKADWEVILQYIQFPKIARDFANYLELYYKYEADYQITQVLGGNIPEILIKKIAHAPFDERLSVVSLLLAQLNTEFRKFRRMGICLELLYERMKEWKLRADQGLPSEEELQRLADNTQLLLQQKKKAQLLSREEAYGLEQTLCWLQMHKASEDPALDFQEEVREYEAMLEQAGIKLEYAFDFLEAVFAESQEMVIFITELNANYYSTQFLQEYECERYYRYNRQLLFDERRSNILRKIEKMDSLR